MRLIDYRTLLFIQTCSLLTVSLAWAQSPYRMQGVVMDVETQQPVSGATIQVLIVSEDEPDRQTRKAISDDEGRYSIDLPAGHAQAWTLLPPDGYCAVKNYDTEAFATTLEKPIFTKNYEVRKGFPIKIAVRSSDKITIPPKTYASLRQQQGDDYFQGFLELDRNGTGTITLPKTTGKFQIFCGDEQGKLVAPDGMIVDFEDGFDPNNVLADITRHEDGTKTVRDANGLTATLRKCDPTVTNKQMAIVIDVHQESPEKVMTRLQGRIVDVHGEGIEGATVTLAFSWKDSGTISRFSTTTSDTGHFTVRIPRLRSGTKVALVITHDGFGGLVTKPMDLAGDTDVGTIKLKAGCSIRVRVVGADGLPLHGAVVEPLNNYASRTRIARTGADGECLLTNLAAGLMKVSARFGTLNKLATIPLQPGENDLVVLKLAPPTRKDSTNPPKYAPVLKAGTAAPEWVISEWTDGKHRKLSDYRGKVVVIDFWGIWCSPCVHAISAMKELYQRYQERDVVFLGIHTAGTDMALVKRLLKQKKWNITVGLDNGDDIVSGETVRRYGIRGYPTIMIIDRDGNISFNSEDTPQNRDALMRDMKSLAELAGLPWPIDKDATEEQIAERITRLQVVMFGRKIEEALKNSTD